MLTPEPVRSASVGYQEQTPNMYQVQPFLSAQHPYGAISYYSEHPTAHSYKHFDKLDNKDYQHQVCYHH